jgi:hypothetical protein
VEVKEEYLQHLSPLGWEHINLTGDFQWNMKQLEVRAKSGQILGRRVINRREE